MKLLRATTGLAFAMLVCGAAPAWSATRVFYASDWPHPTQIFAAGPGTGGLVGQLTFGRAGSSCSLPISCGFVEPLPSPEGKNLAYLETGKPYDWSAGLERVSRDATRT